jgi:hypothetical protein
MLATLCDGPLVEKTRYFVLYGHVTWQVDVHEGLLDGLILAEVELEHEDQGFTRSEWIGREVTGDPRYKRTTSSRITPRRLNVSTIQSGSLSELHAIRDLTLSLSECSGSMRQRTFGSTGNSNRRIWHFHLRPALEGRGPTCTLNEMPSDSHSRLTTPLPAPTSDRLIHDLAVAAGQNEVSLIPNNVGYHASGCTSTELPQERQDQHCRALCTVSRLSS